MTAPAHHMLLRALVDEFTRCGMRHSCTSPGSRNTPVVTALAREPRLQTWSHIDERAAGFFALGAAKASRRPVAVACTSGTAAANLLPAVIEAQQASVPLIVLTADRPPELRDVGAGQTIDQIKLFGDAAKWFFELDLSEASGERLRWVRTVACRAYWTAVSGRPGPVHLNLPLREPLVLDEPLGEWPSGGAGRADGAPWVSVTSVLQHRPAPPALTRGRGRYVLVAGDLGGVDASAGAALAALAERAGVPLLADPLSGARRGAAAVGNYDLLLRHPPTADALRPDLVLRFGDLPTSKPLRNWLGGLGDVAQVAFTEDVAWADPASVLCERWVGPVPAAIHALGEQDLSAEPGWLAAWQAADAAVAGAIEATLSDSGLSEPVVALLLAAELPADATLSVAASMPIRDIEEFARVRDRAPRVLANRGANGIDGTVSSAFGTAAAADGPAVLLIGDVTLAHDIGGLLAAARTRLKLTIVLINNDGGGIFHFLPISRQTDVFEEQVATPPGLDFSHAAALYGLSHERVDSPEALSAALSAALAGSASSMIEIRTDRTDNRTLHADIEAAAVAALSALR